VAPLKLELIPEDMPERVLMSGSLGERTFFEIKVRGPVGVNELINLIRKLDLDLQILRKEDESDASPELLVGPDTW